jgi:polysaccharide export outer membrane protein
VESPKTRRHCDRHVRCNQTSDPADPPSIGPEEPVPTATAKESTQADAAPNTSAARKPLVPAPIPAASPNAPGTSPAPDEPPRIGNTITINLNELMESGDATNNITLLAGDIVTVPHAGIVYVLGAVSRPGGFVLANDRSHMSTLKILALAGGLNRTAKRDHAVIIRKDAQGQQHEVAVNLKKVLERSAEDLLLQPSDILYVPESASKQAMLRAAELGLAIGTGVGLDRIAYH